MNVRRQLKPYDVNQTKFQVPFSLSSPKHGKLNNLLNVKNHASISAPVSPAKKLNSTFYSRQQSNFSGSPFSRPQSSKPKTPHHQSLLGFNLSQKLLLLNDAGSPQEMPNTAMSSVRKETLDALKSDPHIRHRSLLVPQKELQIEAQKSEDPKSYFILKNIQTLHKSYISKKELFRSHNQKSLDQSTFQARQKTLLEMYMMNERNNLTEDEREKFWRFLSNKDIEAILNFRSLEGGPLELESTADIESHPLKFKNNRRLRKLFHEVEAVSKGHYVGIGDYAKIKTEKVAPIPKLSSLENLERAEPEEPEVNHYEEEKNRLTKAGLNTKINLIKSLSKKKPRRKLTDKKRFRPKPNKAVVCKNILSFLRRIKRLKVTVHELATQKVFSTEPYERNGAYTFLKAAKSGVYQVVKDLLIQSRFLNYDFNENRATALHLAAGAGHYEIVQLLINNGGDVNMVDKNSKKPLYYAVKGNHFDIVQLLLFEKSNPWFDGERYDDITQNQGIIGLLKEARKLWIIMTFAPRRLRESLWLGNRMTLMEEIY